MQAAIGSPSDLMSSLQALHQRFEVFLTGFDVHSDSFLFNIRVGADDHDVGRARELVDKADEFLVADDH